MRRSQTDRHYCFFQSELNASFKATQLAGLVIQLRADTGITIATGVSNWADTLSASGLAVAQGTGGLQPTFTASNAAFNNKPTVNFDGVDDFLRGVFALNQPEHVFIVGRWNAAFAVADAMMDGGAGASTMVFYRNAAAQVNLFAGSFVTDSAATPQSVHVHEGVFDGASSLLRADGTTKQTGNVGASNGGGLCLGAFNTPASYGNVSIAEVIIYNRHLSLPEAAGVSRYLGARYGIPVA